jgi:hypothetical protein
VRAVRLHQSTPPFILSFVLSCCGCVSQAAWTAFGEWLALRDELSTATVQTVTLSAVSERLSSMEIKVSFINAELSVSRRLIQVDGLCLECAVHSRHKQEFEDVRKITSLLSVLATPAMQTRHWEELMTRIGRDAREAYALTIRHLVSVKLYDCTCFLSLWLCR